jgi:hypothetical protein
VSVGRTFRGKLSRPERPTEMARLGDQLQAIRQICRADHPSTSVVCAVPPVTPVVCIDRRLPKPELAQLRAGVETLVLRALSGSTSIQSLSDISSCRMGFAITIAYTTSPNCKDQHRVNSWEKQVAGRFRFIRGIALPH